MRFEGGTASRSPRTHKHVRADNGFTRYHLDRFGRRVAIENAAQIDPSADGGVTVNITWRTYNRNDQVTEQYINEGLNRVRYEYDERGLESKRSAAISVIGVTTPEDQKWVDTHIRFDRRGNLMLSEVTSPDDALSLAQRTAITYDLKGNKRTELTGNLDQTAANEWENDYFGRVRVMTDLGGNVTTSEYDGLGNLLSKTGLDKRDDGTFEAGVNIAFTYFENGWLATRADSGISDALTTRYTYTLLGQQATVTEDWASLAGAEDAVTTNTYDSQGRLTGVQHGSPSGGLDDYDVSLSYTYDQVGNRRSVIALKPDEVTGDPVEQAALWYTYDAENRIVISQGRLDDSGTVSLITLDGTENGTEIAYNKDGSRKSATFNQNAGQVTHTYSYDGAGRVISTERAGTLADQKFYDDSGRMIRQVRYNIENDYSFLSASGAPSPAEVVLFDYSDSGKLLEQTTYQYDEVVFEADGTLKSGKTHADATLASQVLYHGGQPGDENGYNEDGTVRQYQVAVYNDNGGFEYTNTYTYDYEYRDKALNTEIIGTSTSTGLLDGKTTQAYDVNGNLVSVDDTKDSNGKRTFRLNAEGQIVEKTQGSERQRYYYSNGHGVASEGDLNPKADYDFNYTPISDQYPPTTPGSYIVSSSNETLETIAMQFWGDASLWYLIADANAKDSRAVSEGEQLIIPNRLTNVRNAADTFKPYEPGKIIGDTTPTLPVPPPPDDDKGCGAAQILVVAISIIATVWTAGAAAGLMGIGGTTAAGATASTWAVGGSIMTGGLAGGVSLTGAGLLSYTAAAFTGGFLGNVAGQLTAKGTGLTDSFSLRDAVSGGLSGSFAAIAAGTILGTAGRLIKPGLGYTATIAGSQYAGSYLGGKIAETGVSFSWSSLTASVVGATVTSQITGRAPGLFGSQESMTLRQRLTGDLIAGSVNATSQRLINNGGEQQWADIAYNAFGQTLGNAAVATLKAEQRKQPAQEALGECALEPVVTPAPAASGPEKAPSEGTTIAGFSTSNDARAPGSDSGDEVADFQSHEASSGQSSGQQRKADGVGNSDEDRIIRKAFVQKGKSGKVTYQDEKGRWTKDPGSVLDEDRSLKRASVRSDAELKVVENEILAYDSGEIVVAPAGMSFGTEGLGGHLGGLHGAVSAGLTSYADVDLMNGELALGTEGSVRIDARYGELHATSELGIANLVLQTVAETNAAARVNLSGPDKGIEMKLSAEAVLFQAKVEAQLETIEFLGVEVEVGGEAVGNLGGVGATIGGYAQEYKTKPGWKLGGEIGITPGAGGRVKLNVGMTYNHQDFERDVEWMKEWLRTLSEREVN